MLRVCPRALADQPSAALHVSAFGPCCALQLCILQSILHDPGSWLDARMPPSTTVPCFCTHAPPAACRAAAALPGQVVFLQRYESGQLVAEQVLRVAHKDVRKKQQKKEGKKRGGRNGCGVHPAARRRGRPPWLLRRDPRLDAAP